MSKTLNEAPAFTVTMEVTGAHEEAMNDALDYLRERLLGPIPEVFTEIAAEVSRTVWEGYSREGVAIRIVGEDGQPLAEPRDQTPEEIAEEAAAVEGYVAWMESPEGRAELDRDERFYEFTEAHKAETAALYASWLESRAQLFRRASKDWHRERREALKEQFAETEKNQENEHV